MKSRWSARAPTAELPVGLTAARSRANRDFPNSRDRLRRLESIDSDARLTLVQRSAPVESTLKQEWARVRAAAETRGLECHQRARHVGQIRSQSRSA